MSEHYRAEVANAGVPAEHMEALRALPDIDYKALWDAVVEYGPQVVAVILKVLGKNKAG